MIEIYLDKYDVKKSKEFLKNELHFDDCLLRYDLQDSYIFDCYKDDERTIIKVYI